jgi:hypothetical protein
MKCPCKNCIVLPICKNKDDIYCELLFEFVNKHVRNQRSYQSRVTAPIISIFNKRVAAIGPNCRVRLMELALYEKVRYSNGLSV